MWSPGHFVGSLLYCVPALFLRNLAEVGSGARAGDGSGVEAGVKDSLNHLHTDLLLPRLAYLLVHIPE